MIGGGSTLTAKRPATYEDLLAVPDHKVAEILAGELVVSPRPASPHAYANSAMGSALFGSFGPGGAGGSGPGDWWIIDEPELHFDADVLVPDQAGWRRERMPRFEDVPYFTLAPDWVCEVLSPSTARIDRVRKMPIYARAGVGHVWLVDPRIRILEVFRLEEGRWVLIGQYEGDAAIRAEPFDAVELDMGQWWVPEEALGEAPADTVPG